MKSIIFAAIIFATSFSVEAIEIGRIRNDGGGAIVFTSETCKADKDKYLFFGYIAGGQAASGCWVVIGEEIFAQWQDGDIRIYPVNALTLSDDFRRAVAQRGKREAM